MPLPSVFVNLALNKEQLKELNKKLVTCIACIINDFHRILCIVLNRDLQEIVKNNIYNID